MFTNPENRLQSNFDKLKRTKYNDREGEIFIRAYESAKRRCENVMSRDNWGYELCQRLCKILERGYYGFPQRIYDHEEKELIMAYLNIK
jgi:hypothetical protein